MVRWRVCVAKVLQRCEWYWWSVWWGVKDFWPYQAFSLPQQHGNRKSIWPVKMCSSCPQSQAFCFGKRCSARTTLKIKSWEIVVDGNWNPTCASNQSGTMQTTGIYHKATGAGLHVELWCKTPWTHTKIDATCFGLQLIFLQYCVPLSMDEFVLWDWCTDVRESIIADAVDEHRVTFWPSPLTLWYKYKLYCYKF